jgi:hypothetical protein
MQYIFQFLLLIKLRELVSGTSCWEDSYTLIRITKYGQVRIISKQLIHAYASAMMLSMHGVVTCTKWHFFQLIPLEHWRIAP